MRGSPVALHSLATTRCRSSVSHTRASIARDATASLPSLSRVPSLASTHRLRDSHSASCAWVQSFYMSRWAAAAHHQSTQPHASRSTGVDPPRTLIGSASPH